MRLVADVNLRVFLVTLYDPWGDERYVHGIKQRIVMLTPRYMTALQALKTFAKKRGLVLKELHRNSDKSASGYRQEKVRETRFEVAYELAHIKVEPLSHMLIKRRKARRRARR